MISLFDKLLKRGLISGIYPESCAYRDKLRQVLSGNEHVTVYTGFDATSSSLHVGNLATIMNSLYFYGHGHQVICVIGDATTRIGDPSGHTRDRRPVDKSAIPKNAEAMGRTLEHLFENYRINFLTHSDTKLRKPIIVRNSEWYSGFSVLDFVDSIFRDVRVGGLLHKRSIQDRLQTQEGMNMAEFSYQIFQAYDWLELRKRYDCRIQIGGNDQQGNIYTGHDLIRKRLNCNDSIGLLAPLITNSKGKKLGKSTERSDASIWLNADMTKPYDIYQFFHRTPDASVERYLRIFSFYEDDYIDELVKTKLKDKSDIWHCQRKLAEHVCQLIHGREGLEQAKRCTEASFPKTEAKSR